MIMGEVAPTREPLIQVAVCGPSGETIELGAVVDTGFTDYLTLSRDIVQLLKLKYLDTATYELADGGEAECNLYEGSVLWDGRWRQAIISRVESGPLVGMGLMEGYHLGIDVLDGGRVEIRPIEE